MTRPPSSLSLLALGLCFLSGPITPAFPQAPTEGGEKYPDGLPRYLAPEEEGLPLPLPTRGSPPAGVIRCPAEYEPAQGLLIAWEGYTNILTEMTVAITTLDPEAIVYVVVDNASEQTSATSTLSSAGADMSQVQFIVRVTDTVWIRDYGPRFIFEDGSRAIIDHTYNRPRPNDDAFPDYLSALWGEPQYDIPLTHGGGNFHLFSNGDAFMTSLIQTENPGLTAQQIKDLYAAYQNVDLTIYPGFPTSVDSTQHIDMWMFPLDDNRIIIGQYSGTSSYQPKTITDNATADLVSRGYTVYRTPGWNSGTGGYGGTHYTYTNAVILNDLLFISKFGGSYASQDAQALTVYQTAMPGKTIRQIDCSGIIGAAGAMHCIVMHVPAYVTTMRVSPESDLASGGPAGGPFTPGSMAYTLENTGDVPIDYSATKTADWLSLSSASGTIPANSSTTVTVSISDDAATYVGGMFDDIVAFTNLTDHSGDTTRSVSLTIGESVKVYDFPMNTNPGWTTQGQWAFGDPAGLGGDPNNGHTGTNVYGYNLNGTYTNNMPRYRLTTTALDCSSLVGAQLKFWRWLGVENAAFDHAGLEISSNGTTWTSLWEHTGPTIAETAWTQWTYDLSAVADQQATVYLRWALGTTDTAGVYCGWNIDDVEIWGILADPCAAAGHTPGDVNGDDAVDGLDVQAFVALITNPAGPWTTAQRCAADGNSDGRTDLADAAPFAALLLNP